MCDKSQLQEQGSTMGPFGALKSLEITHETQQNALQSHHNLQTISPMDFNRENETKEEQEEQMQQNKQHVTYVYVSGPM